MVMQAAKNLVIAMSEHNGAQSQTHHEQGKGLQTIEIAQSRASLKKLEEYYSRRSVTRKEPGRKGAPENDCTRSRSFDNVAPPAGCQSGKLKYALLSLPEALLPRDPENHRNNLRGCVFEVLIGSRMKC